MISNAQVPVRQVPPVLVVTGPTASGKTAAALILAEQLSGEIISADSMQIYRGMDIGTAKATPAERKRVPHHLLDICEPGDRFSVADYKKAATQVIREIYDRGHLPILCGGTGQYLSAMIEGLTFTEIPIDFQLRESLNQEAANKGLEYLYRQLQSVDPETAARLAPADQKRIIRALEVYQQTGKSVGQLNQESRLAGPDFQYSGFCLSPDRQILYERINLRVQHMISEGLADEVRRLLAFDLPIGSTCLQAIGYKEMLPYIRGEESLESTIDCISQATRRYAKRQLTWFRKMPGLRWLVNQTTEENVKIILDSY